MESSSPLILRTNKPPVSSSSQLSYAYNGRSPEAEQQARCRRRNRQRYRHRSPPQGSPGGHRLQKRRRHPRQRIYRSQVRQSRRRDRCPHRKTGEQGRHRRPLPRKSRVQKELGQDPHHLQRRRHHHRQGQIHRQRRPGRQRRRRGLPALLPDRRHHPEESRRFRRQHLRIQGRQNQPGTPEHRSVPPRIDRSRAQRKTQQVARRK